MIEVSQSVDIVASLWEVFDHLQHPRHAARWLPGLTSTLNERLRRGATFDWALLTGGRHLRGVGEVVEVVSNRRLTLVTRGDVVSMWAWSLEGHDHGTRLTLRLSLTHAPIDAARKRSLRRLVARQVSNALARLEQTVEADRQSALHALLRGHPSVRPEATAEAPAA